MKTLKVIVLSSFMAITLSSATASAVGVNPFEDVCKKNSESSVCKDAKNGQKGNPLYGPDGIITIIVKLLSIVVGVGAVIGIIVAGIRFITSGSNPQDANNARELVIYSVVGLLVAAFAQIIIRAVLYKIRV